VEPQAMAIARQWLSKPILVVTDILKHRNCQEVFSTQSMAKLYRWGKVGKDSNIYLLVRTVGQRQ
jgi:hypothetical protein